MGCEIHFAMRNDNIIINGKKINGANVAALISNGESQDSWQHAVYLFLVDWFSDAEVIKTSTSGSTGDPKSILLAKSTMRNSARMTNAYFGLDAKKTALLCLPASYIAGKMMLVRAIIGGFNLLVVEPTANPFENLSQKIDFAAITPYQLFHSVESLKTNTVKQIIVGGSPISPSLEKLISTIPTEIFETYGMTETASHIALRKCTGVDKTDSFCVLNGVSIQQDNRGCLIVNAPHLIDEEICTKDIVELLDDKHFRWKGRADRIINSAGVKIHPEQVEKKLEGIFQQPFFIASIPDELLGNKVVLVLESEALDKETEAKLCAAMQMVLSKYELPKQILYLAHFCYSPTKKLLRIDTLLLVTSF